MRYRNKYTKDDIPQDAGILFGPISVSKQYELIKGNNSIYYIRSINDKKQELSYLDINENQLYTNILNYGKELYEILKEKLYSIDITKLTSRKPNNIIYNNDIASNIDIIKTICIDFINNYGFPFAVDDEEIIKNDAFMYLNKECYNIVPVISIVRYILILFMLHQSLIHLDNLKTNYPEIYSCLFQNYENTNLDMLEALAKYVNSSNNFLNISSKYKIKILETDYGNLIPIRYTTNIFTLGFEVFTNCLCTYSFQEEEKDNTASYVSFRKCQKCLKNIFDEPYLDISDHRIPFNKTYICDDCKKEAKKIASQKYEHSLREMYDNIKKNKLSISNATLISEIDLMPPKDKVSKSYLKELQEKIEKEKDKN